MSVSTVDRVLNQRGSVAVDKFRRVIETARALHFERSLPEPWNSTRRIEVLMPRNPTPFWAMLNHGLERQAEQLPKPYLMQRIHLPQSDIAAWKEAIEHPVGPRHALIIAADTDDGIKPSLELCQRRGEIVISLTSEIDGFHPDGHSGIDNWAAGRTAGLLMLAMTGGRDGALLVLPPHSRRAEHRQRVAGFRDAIAGRMPVVVEPTDEDPQAMVAIVRRHLASSALAGIYDSGFDSAEIAAILATVPQRPRWIAHECSPLHRRCLHDGVLDFVLDQAPDVQARYAVEQVLARSDPAMASPVSPAKPELRIICRENIPAPSR